MPELAKLLLLEGNEFVVLLLKCQNKTHEEIAAQLVYEPGSVQKISSRMLAKLGLSEKDAQGRPKHWQTMKQELKASGFCKLAETILKEEVKADLEGDAASLWDIWAAKQREELGRLYIEALAAASEDASQKQEKQPEKQEKQEPVSVQQGEKQDQSKEAATPPPPMPHPPSNLTGGSGAEPPPPPAPQPTFRPIPKFPFPIYLTIAVVIGLLLCLLLCVLPVAAINGRSFLTWISQPFVVVAVTQTPQVHSTQPSQVVVPQATSTPTHQTRPTDTAKPVDTVPPTTPAPTASPTTAPTATDTPLPPPSNTPAPTNTATETLVPSPTPVILFQSNFDDGTLGGLHPSSSNWTIANGRLTAGKRIWFSVGDGTWKNYKIQLNTGVLSCFTSSTTGTIIELRTGGSPLYGFNVTGCGVQWGTMDNEFWGAIAGTKQSNPGDGPFSVTVMANGPLLDGVSGALHSSVSTTKLTGGIIIDLEYGHWIDDVVIVALP